MPASPSEALRVAAADPTAAAATLRGADTSPSARSMKRRISASGVPGENDLLRGDGARFNSSRRSRRGSDLRNGCDTEPPWRSCAVAFDRQESYLSGTRPKSDRVPNVRKVMPAVEGVRTARPSGPRGWLDPPDAG